VERIGSVCVSLWKLELKHAIGVLHLQGNVDPMILFGTEDVIHEAVEECLRDAGGRHHILNVRAGIIQGTPEEAMKFLCQLARESSSQQQCINVTQSTLQGVVNPSAVELLHV
jgi:uroporphyrinogen-III decarboxylase